MTPPWAPGDQQEINDDVGDLTSLEEGHMAARQRRTQPQLDGAVKKVQGVSFPGSSCDIEAPAAYDRVEIPLDRSAEARLGRVVMELLRLGALEGDVGFYAGCLNNVHFLSYEHQFDGAPVDPDAVSTTLRTALSLQKSSATLTATATEVLCRDSLVLLLVTVKDNDRPVDPVNTDEHHISLLSFTEDTKLDVVQRQFARVLPSRPMELLQVTRPLFCTSRQLWLTSELSSACCSLLQTQVGLSWFRTTRKGTYLHVSI